MKDKVMMMYDHIISSADVEPWAKEEFKRMLSAYLADGCSGCAFESTEEWEMPCRRCKRNCKDYWRSGMHSAWREIDEASTVFEEDES